MERVSSVTAFICRYLGPAGVDAEARDVLGSMTATERRILELLACSHDQEDRRERLTRETGAAWTAARYARCEGLALHRLRQELMRRGLLQP